MKDETNNRVWSPPKAGRTWLRAAFGKLYAIQNNESDRNVLKLSRKIVSFSHKIEQITPEHKSIFLIRDPKDLFVSEYFQYKYRIQVKNPISIKEYLRLDWNPIKTTINTYCTYKRLSDQYEHTKTVQYEWLVKNFKQKLKEIFKFFDIEYTHSELTEIVQWCEFDNLQQLSRQLYFKSGEFNPIDVNDPESFKFRIGKVGGYRTYLSDEDIEYIDDIYTKLEFKYDVWTPNSRSDFHIKFLKENGLKPNHYFLDIGCGLLKGSLPLIDYLERGHYFGFDINPNLIDKAKQNTQAIGLENKNPTLLASDVSKIKLNRKFDFILAYAVLFHMSDQSVRDTFKLVRNCLTDKGVFYMNAFTLPRITKKWRTFTTVSRTVQFYKDEAEKQGLVAYDFASMEELGKITPRKDTNEMRMFKITKC